MRKLLTFIAIFAFFKMNAQYESGTLFFKDGKIEQGLIKQRNFGGIKFKKNKDSEALTYDYNQITGYDTDNQHYEYKKEKNTSPKLVELLTKGKFNLYSLQKSNPGSAIPGGGGATFGGGTATIYFLERGERFIRLGTKIKKKNLSFFNDCPVLIEKINKKILKRKNVRDIIDFYNTNCN